MNDDAKMIMERVEMLYDEIHRLKNALVAIQEGKSPEEAFSEYVFLEEKAERKSAVKYLTTMMEHLLKLKYCTNNRNHNEWRETIFRSRDNASYEVAWKTGGVDNDITRYIINVKMTDMYDDAISRYKRLMTDEYQDLEYGYKFIPKDCPWTLVDLLDKFTPALLKQFPDPDNVSNGVSMQLYPDICHFLDGENLSDEIKMKTCDDCKFFPECISEYYNK